MDFFGFGASADLSTPIGMLIKSATDPILGSSDWSKNLEICDTVCSTTDGNEQAVKAITRRLQDSDQKVVYLALIVAETCMKNCGPAFAETIQQPFMDEMTHIARESKGARNADEALRLIQQWGRAFERKRNCRIFFNTFMNMKSKGVRFPPEDESTSTATAATFDVAPPEVIAAIAPPAPARSNKREFEKLDADLTNVGEKVRMCREMLQESPGIFEDEALAEVVGFLEACRDRMIDIIEAGTQGLLGEELFAKCLRINDAVLRTLEAEKTGVKIAVDDGDSKESERTEVKSGGDDLIQLDGDSSTTTAPKPKMTSVGAATMNDDDDDEFGSLTLKTSKHLGGTASRPVAAPIKKLAPPPGSGAASHNANASSSLIDTTIQPVPAPAPAPVPAPAPWNGGSLLDPFTPPPTSAPITYTAPPMPAASTHDHIPPAQQASDMDIFFNSPSTLPAPPVQQQAPAPYNPFDAAPAPAPKPAPAPAPASMTDADFDSFLNTLSTNK